MPTVACLSQVLPCRVSPAAHSVSCCEELKFTVQQPKKVLSKHALLQEGPCRGNRFHELLDNLRAAILVFSEVLHLLTALIMLQV